MSSSGISTQSAELSDAVQELVICEQVSFYLFIFEVDLLSRTFFLQENQGRKTLRKKWLSSICVDSSYWKYCVLKSDLVLLSSVFQDLRLLGFVG